MARSDVQTEIGVNWCQMKTNHAQVSSFLLMCILPDALGLAGV